MRRGGLAVVLLGIGAIVAMLIAGRVGDTIRDVTLPLRYEATIRQQADDKGLDPALIAGVIYAESKFTDRTSSAGAKGLMQIRPDTARFIARNSGGTAFELADLANPDINIRYGSWYLNHLLERFDGDETAAIAAYNAGPENVTKWGGPGLDESDIHFAETRKYVDTVLSKRGAYRATYPAELGLRKG